MARQERRTTPLLSKFGPLQTFEEQEPHLIGAEWRGRKWAFAQAQTGTSLSDVGILDLHNAMFEPLLTWAGQSRTEDVGPGGKVQVPYYRVRLELRKLADDFAAWMAVAGRDPTLQEIASIVADTHHRFQWIHPFVDTNGRTGRVLDHWVLWSSFALCGQSMEASPIIEYFPSAVEEDNYYEGLNEADLHSPQRLRAFYLARLEHALTPVFTIHWWDGANRTSCVAIHDSLDSAVDDLIRCSKEDPTHRFVLRGEGGYTVVYALGGKLVNLNGLEVQRPR